MSLFAEIKRRKILQVVAAYAVVAWLAVQIAATVEAPLNLPDWFDTLVIALLGLGFPVTLIVSWAFDFTADGLVRDSGASDRPQSQGRSIEYLLIGLLIVAVGWLFYRDLMMTDDPAVAGPGSASVPSEPQIEPLANSVAVLPCDNLSPDPDDAYFALSIHEEILNRLAKIGDMHVISRTSMMRYADARPAIPEIAQALRVETVMECSVRFAGDNVLVTAQLIDPETDSHLWSDSYPGSLNDVSTIFAMQADIAMNIANALNAEFSGAEQARIAVRPTNSGEAYGLYLRALSRYEGETFATLADLQPTLALLDEAIRIDPEFAPAHGLKGRIYYFLGDVEAAREAGERAVAIDPANSTGLWVTLNALHGTGRTDEARRLIEQAIESNPGDADLHMTVAMHQEMSGTLEEARRSIERAASIDPGNAEILQLAGMLNAAAGDLTTAETYLRQALQRKPASPAARLELARVLTRLGREREAAESLEIGENVAGPNMNAVGLSAYIYAYSLAGRPDDATRLFERFEALASAESVPDFVQARAYLGVGDYDAALSAFRRIVAAQNIFLGTAGIGLLTNQANDPALERPEFVEVREAIATRLENSSAR